MRFIGATLWAGRPAFRIASEALADDRRGRPEPFRAGNITHGDEAGLHAAQRLRIAALLEQTLDDLPVMVVTHHAPLTDRVPPGLRTHPGAGLFASDLSALMTGKRIALWVHGHIHAGEGRVHDSGTCIVTL
ncbi:metallophosphoesterase family protein [Kozakia baliensis]|nr:hypothetical protein [Kozakia baliensis]GBR27886.1 hypothetical protein AA0488_1270 [Kozakia baliensis NRIC 0488]GEL65342.1 hypothetical protein KBA01_26280 [Kozakia baliensis]